MSYLCIVKIETEKKRPEMDKISVNVSDSVYGRSCIAGNSLHTTSLHNGVVFLEGAQKNQTLTKQFVSVFFLLD